MNRCAFATCGASREGSKATHDLFLTAIPRAVTLGMTNRAQVRAGDFADALGNRVARID
jgi:hypothetical protein